MGGPSDPSMNERVGIGDIFGGKRPLVAAAFARGCCMIVLNATYESISIDGASDIETPYMHNESPTIARLLAVG